MTFPLNIFSRHNTWYATKKCKGVDHCPKADHTTGLGYFAYLSGWGYNKYRLVFILVKGTQSDFFYWIILTELVNRSLSKNSGFKIFSGNIIKKLYITYPLHQTDIQDFSKFYGGIEQKEIFSQSP